MRAPIFFVLLFGVWWFCVNWGWIGTAAGLIATIELGEWYMRRPFLSIRLAGLALLAVALSYGLTFLHPFWDQHPNTAATVTALIAVAGTIIWVAHTIRSRSHAG